MIGVRGDEHIPETLRGRQLKHIRPMSGSKPFDEKSIWMIRAMVWQFIIIRVVGAAQEEMCNLDQNGIFCGAVYKLAKLALTTLSIAVAVYALLTL